MAKEAEAKIREAIRELLPANPDENKAEAAILILAAKAAKLLSPDVLLAEKMLKKVRAMQKATRNKLAAKGRQ